MLPNLSRLVINSDAETGNYSASPYCPVPPAAGDLRNGVTLTPGRSGILKRADGGNYDGGLSLSLQETNDDWKKGVVVLDAPTTFVHVATGGLPVDLRMGDKLRMAERTYAHTDIEQWTWKGADRVVIHWPAGMPYQIMSGLRRDDMQPYVRSCRIMQSKDAVALTPKDVDGESVIEWPFANVAVVLPSAFYSVRSTPERVPDPQELAMQNAELLDNNDLRQLANNAMVMPSSGKGLTIFSSDNEDNLIQLKSLFDKTDSGFQRYTSELSGKVVDAAKKRKAFLVAVAVMEHNMTFELRVERTIMYKELVIDAHYIDMSKSVALSMWNPEQYEFQMPYGKSASTRPVLIDGTLGPEFYVQAFIHSSESTDHLLVAFDTKIKTTESTASDVVPLTLKQVTEQSFEMLFKSPLEVNPLLQNALTQTMKAYGLASDTSLVFESVAMLLTKIVDTDGVDLTPALPTRPGDWNEVFGLAVDIAEQHDEDVGKALLSRMVGKIDEKTYQRVMERIDADKDPEELIPFFINTLGLKLPPGGLDNYEGKVFMDSEW